MFQLIKGLQVELFNLLDMLSQKGIILKIIIDFIYIYDLNQHGALLEHLSTAKRCLSNVGDWCHDNMKLHGYFR